MMLVLIGGCGPAGKQPVHITPGVDAAPPVRVEHTGRIIVDCTPASAVVNVDTNFDQRAFRTVLRHLEEAASRYQNDVTQILAAAEHAPEAPAPASEPTGSVSDDYGYRTAIQEELEALGFHPVCPAGEGHCTYEIDSEEARNVFGVSVRYDSRAHLVTVAIDRFLTAPPENPRSVRLVARRMELNWDQLVPMYQWNSHTNDVRLAGVVNTDSNFDRRAFRGVVQAIRSAGERNYRELRGMLNP